MVKPANNTGSVQNAISEYHSNVALDLNKKRILGVLAGQDLPSDRIAQWARSAELVLAADGGANLLFENGIVPDLTIGDFDSIIDSTKDAQTTLVHKPDQDFSDCEKLLKYAAGLGFRKITLCGIEGDLVDHLLGTLLAVAKSPMDVRLVTRRGIAWVLHGPMDSTFDLPVNTRLSLLPITECSGVSLSGVKWPLKEVELSPMGLCSLSNRTLGPVSVSMAAGVAGLFLSNSLLESPYWSD